MRKERGKRFVLFGSLFEIFLLISLSFAIAFILDAENVRATDPPKVNLMQGDKTVIPTPSSTTTLNVVPRGGDAVKITLKAGHIEGAPPRFSEVSGKVTSIDTSTQTVIVDGNSYPLTKEAFESVQNQLGSISDLVPPVAEKEFSLPLVGKIATGGVAHLLEGAMWALVAVGAIQLIGNLAGLEKGLTNALTYAAVGGIMSAKLLASLGPSGFKLLDAQNFLVSKAPLIGIGIGVAIFLLTYKKEKKQIVNFQCMPYEPPLGGSQCEECNKDPFRPCSEYRCKALGQACQLINQGTAEERCVWVGRGDVKSPTIEPWTEALSPRGLKYVPDNAIRPPNRGVKIVTQNNRCLPAFTPLEFGIRLDEPAQCKIDYRNNASFAEMQFYFGESNYYRYNHTQKIRLPGPDTGIAGENSPAPVLQNNGEFNLYVRCQDANGNVNVDIFAFNFCVEQGPDTTPPLIEGTSIESGSPVQFNADKVQIELYINEPSECKWSREDKNYNDMENAMSCGKESFEVNANLQYTCIANLTGIRNREDNKFYFRCKDQPGKDENVRNTNSQSKELILKGSQPLNIIRTSPNTIIYGSTETVTVTLEVETDDGAEEGKAICYFSPTGLEKSFIAMFNTNSHIHSQKLDLITGNYNYYFRCIDAGGNTAESNATFKVFADRTAPKVTRVYKDGVDALKIVTDEDAQCAYSTINCNYNLKEGIILLNPNANNKVNHLAQWKPSTSYYIKCKDSYGNEPSPNECSIVVSASLFGERGQTS